MKKRKIVLISIVIVIICLIGGIFKYLTFSLPADEEALQALQKTNDITIEEDKDTIVFKPKGELPKTGLIYYPGGQVEPQSFAYAARGIAEQGYLVVIQKMPFNLAMFGKDKAYDITKEYRSVENWYLSGFSLGGVAACMALSEEASPFKGLILYASYTTKNYDLSQSNLRVLSLSGSNDGLSTKADIEKGKSYLPINTTYKEIPGANHTQFAIYGNSQLQKGDNAPGISRMAQQDILISETTNFLSNPR